MVAATRLDGENCLDFGGGANSTCHRAGFRGEGMA